MSSKRNKNREIPADFSLCIHEVEKMRHNLTKNSGNNPNVVKSLLESNCKRFRQSAIREHVNLKPEAQMKKNSFQEPRRLYKAELVSHFVPLFLCEHTLSTIFKTRMQLKKFKFSLVSAIRKKNFPATAGPTTSK